MEDKNYIIDIQPGRQPYNSYLVLPLHLLQVLTPLLMREILKGKVATEGGDRVALHLQLEDTKILEVRRIVSMQKAG